jgi:hypothetical protein
MLESIPMFGIKNANSCVKICQRLREKMPEVGIK